jgi:hypothetical protein
MVESLGTGDSFKEKEDWLVANADVVGGALYKFFVNGQINAQNTDVIDLSTSATHNMRAGSVISFAEGDYAFDNFTTGLGGEDRNELTVLSLVKVNADDTGVIVSLGDYFNDRRVFDIRLNAGKIRVLISGDGTVSSETTKYYWADEAIANDTWTWVGFTFKDNVLKLIQDSDHDITIGTKSLDGTVNSLNANVADPIAFHIYRRDNFWDSSSTLRLGAKSCHHLIANKALSSAEITAFQNNGTLPSSLFNFWDFSEESGTNIRGVAGTTGSLVGASRVTDNDIFWSYVNRNGFNVSGSEVIPAKASNKEIDVAGNNVVNRGKGRMPATSDTDFGTDYTGGISTATVTLGDTPESNALTTKVITSDMTDNSRQVHEGEFEFKGYYTEVS